MADPPGGQGLGAVRHVQKLARQSMVLLSTGAFSYVGSFALQLILARALGVEGFGAWIVAFSFVETLAIVGLLGGDWIILRHGSYYHGVGDVPRLRATIRFALLVGGTTLVVLATALALLASMVAVRVFHAEPVIPLLRLAAATGAVTGLRQILVYGTQAFKSVRDAALIRGILQPLARLLLIGLALLLFRSTSSALVGLLAAEIILLVAAGALLHRRVPLIGHTEPIDRAALMKFGLSVMGTRLTEAIRGQLFPVLLASLVALSASGLYAAARRITAAPGLIVNAMNQVYNPIASDLFLQGKREEFEFLTKSMAKWTFSLILPLFGLAVVFPREILSVFGPSFRDAGSALIIMAVGMLFLFGTGPVTGILILSGRPRLSLIDYLSAMSIEVVLALLLIPRYGLIGAAIASTSGRLVNNALPLFQVWVTLRFHPYRPDYWKPIVAALAAVVTAKLIVTSVGLGSGIVAAVAATVLVCAGYAGLMLLLGFSLEDRAVFDHFVRRVKKGVGPGGARGADPSVLDYPNASADRETP
ncbi:MAG: polysaccharide biosynthesis C-terminal domain-containing protein [Actinomycetota bacterium]|nr:polysaccharide biosynthesis C-terminal domain-containing protein [Actinomycetota bacterium]